MRSEEPAMSEPSPEPEDLSAAPVDGSAPAVHTPPILTALPVLPDPRFWKAVLWFLLSLLAGFLMGITLGMGMRIRGHKPELSVVVIVGLTLSSLVFLVLTGFILGTHVRRALAL